MMHGPKTQDCKNLPSQVNGLLSNSNSLSLQLNNVVSTSICFMLVVRSGTNSVNMSRIDDVDGKCT